MTRPAANAGPAAPPMPNGQALVVADRAAAPALREALAQVGFSTVVVADAYAATLELVRRPLAFRGLLLSLAAAHPEELGIIELVKRRFAHMDVILADTEGRSAALAEAVRLGADALLDGNRLLRVHSPGDSSASQRPPREWRPPGARVSESSEPVTVPDPVLSADELRALLGE